MYKRRNLRCSNCRYKGLVYDGKGLVGYTAARWGSPAEFATGRLGFGGHWWGSAGPAGPSPSSKAIGLKEMSLASWYIPSTFIHHGSIFVLVFSKFYYGPLWEPFFITQIAYGTLLCMVGGSSGTVFAWDLRLQQQPILPSGAGLCGTVQPASESEVWEVQYDSYSQSSSIGSAFSARILPIMMCSEDGILAVLEQGEEPLELLAEPCAINAFDVDPQNPSDVICALEWEAIGILMRQRETLPAY